MADPVVDDAFGDPTRSRLRRALLVVCIGTLAASLWLGARFFQQVRAHEEAKRAELLQVTQRAAAQIDRLLQPVGAAAQGLAGRLTRGQVAGEAVVAELNAMVKANEVFFGGTVAYRPHGHDPRTRLYAPYVERSRALAGAAPTQLGDDYDYTLASTDAKTDWYVQPMAEGGQDGWSPPYFDPALATTMITYSAVFMNPAAPTQKLGVVTLDVTTDQFKKITRELDVGPGGFGALTTREGVYLYHPDERLVRQRKTLLDVARERHDDDRLALAEAAAALDSGVISHRSTTTGERSWLVYAPLKSSGWSLQVTFVRNDVPAAVEALRQQGVWITIVLIGFAGSLALLGLRAHEGRSRQLWAGTAVVSVLLLAGIGTVWYLALNHHATSRTRASAVGPEAEIAIGNREALRRQQEKFVQQRRERKQEEPLFVPTGLHIEAMELDASSAVSISGQLWQKYPATLAASSPRGVVFSGAKDLKLTPIDQRLDAANQVIVYRSAFQFVLRPWFNFSRYPLEIERFGIGIGPVERGGTQVLVPDLDSYNILLASQKPGLAPDLQVRGWTVESTAFVLRPRSENSRFGLPTRVDLEEFPALVYEIGLKRAFVDAFISNLTPLIVVAIVLFSLLLLPETVGIKEILALSISLLFVVVYAHLSIRRTIASGQIFYLEYFFLVTYAALLVVPINAFCRALDAPYPLLEYRHGLVMKVLYWPVMLGVFFVITAVKFF